MENLTGRQFGPYRILSPLGAGGMAAVYEAYQPSMDRKVALKVLPRHLASDPEFVQRFEREARLLAQMQHPHILPVHDFGQADSYTYLVMPFIEGGTLADRMQGEPLPIGQATEVLGQVSKALEYAHSRGLIHRDIKPSNVLIDTTGNCLLADFGLARIAEGSSKLTATGTVLGTPAYMSPEQGLGETLTVASDIYSLGIVVYEMLTGRVPFSAETPMAVVHKHIYEPLPLPRSVNPALPAAAETVLLKALAKPPSDRYQSASDFDRALAEAHDRESGRVPASEVGRATTVRARVPRLGGLTLRTVALAVGTIALMTVGAIIVRSISDRPAAAPVRTSTLQAAADSQPGPPATELVDVLSSFRASSGTASAMAPTEQVPAVALDSDPFGGSEQQAVRTAERFPAPGDTVAGITWDGTSLYVSDSFTNNIFLLDTNGTIKDVISTEYSPVGLAWDGSHLWVYESRYVGPPWDVVVRYQLGGAVATAISEFESPLGTTGGQLINDLEWAGDSLWVSDHGQFRISRFDRTGAELDSFVFREAVVGLAWDGTHFWLAYETDFETAVSIVDPGGAELAASTAPLVEIRGLAWIDGSLWAVGRDETFAESIFRLDVTSLIETLD